MSMKSLLAKFLGQSANWLLKTFTKGGTSFPGKLALNIDPTILSHLSKDYDVLIITGTNGKTLTTSLTYHALMEKYPCVITNSSGSNMIQGIVSTFLSAPAKNKNEKGLAVLEVDEGSLINVVKYVKPLAFLYTNLFEDQLDRFGSVEAVYQKLVDAALLAPNALILSNADCPILQSQDLPNPRKYFGFQLLQDNIHQATDNLEQCPHCHSNLIYHSHSYAGLGDYECPKCHFKRPALDYAVTSIDEQTIHDSHFTINEFPIRIPVAGLYNIYNGLAAFSIAHYLDVEPELIAQGFTNIESIFGRQEIIQIKDKTLIMNLVKNPVGFNQIVDLLQLDEDTSSLFLLFNNNYADGTDILWIEQANFEGLLEMDLDHIFISGMVNQELEQRLIKAGFHKEQITCLTSFEETLDHIKTNYHPKVHILASYTATVTFRKLLEKQGYL